MRRMQNKKDLLLNIFEFRLFDFLISETDLEKSNTSQKLVDQVVQDYFSSLKTQGHIPLRFEKQIKEDLREEVLEIYRKKTYGHLHLQSYKKQQLKKSFS